MEARFTGPVMVTGCCRFTGDVMLTVLVAMFIWAAMVTGLLPMRFTAEVMAVEFVTGVVVAELLCTLLASFRGPEWFHCQSLMPIQKYRHIWGYKSTGQQWQHLGVSFNSWHG